ncbi:AFR431Cp [Eremothecium gossypii ATCC 10895]|uniref:Phosphatidyl-N-methylethanolamine N-methyltransferase n=1 Tax=Eremothecium gossypii (strain ATCC 10895 / CBS 109.51 / FGSC 9923 / NRRL Y-1056) TaxID=284811 RepID=Q752Z0_EREGS|nr:AFR431Cp [Eremothecium gossypii ATCC 10895]AAS53802.1 AFR431Cp [Eremothecium gossypii ATCC 10895]AEY98114.1 FAFR431Cp [Eremothecium gossypii FDAG1]
MGIKDLKLNDMLLDAVADINGDDRDFRMAVFFIVFNPLFWNIVAQVEYKTHFLTRLAGGARRGCYALAFVIFSLGLVRDYYFSRALKNQVTTAWLDQDAVRYAGAGLFVFGQVLVLSSMWRLGVTGTYLGDYFGILMEDRVTSFPFNVSDNPMYQGSTLTFLGTSLYYGKAAGVFAALLVNLMYTMALKLEEPFTAMIYAKRDEERAQKAK